MLAPLAARLLATPLILGSGSATRASILRDIGLEFEVAKPSIDEKAIRFPDAAQLVMALGKAKAAALMTGERGARFRERGALLLTGDQVVVCDGTIREKPESEAEARAFIRDYATMAPSTVGSCVVTDAASGQQWSALDKATIHFSPDGLPPDSVDELIAEGSVFHCAGGLMVEHPLVSPHVTRIDGTLDAVMGLSKETAITLLEEALAARRAR